MLVSCYDSAIHCAYCYVTCTHLHLECVLFPHSNSVGATTVGSGEGVEGEDEDIDFGYWEKAGLPVQESALPVSAQTTTTTSLPDTGSKDTAPTTSPPRDIDLSLL